MRAAVSEPCSSKIEAAISIARVAMARMKEDEAISLSEAARRYGVPQPLLSRWVRWGLIRFFGREGKEYRVSAEDVRRLAEIYHEVKAREGGFKGRSIRRILRKRGLLQD